MIARPASRERPADRLYARFEAGLPVNDDELSDVLYAVAVALGDKPVLKARRSRAGLLAQEELAALIRSPDWSEPSLNTSRS